MLLRLSLLVPLALTACQSATVPKDTGEAVTALPDVDGDGYDIERDCDDADAGVHPDSNERCDERGVDDDCDGLVNDADTNFLEGERTEWYPDADGDGFGDVSQRVLACADPSTDALAYVADASDCDDANAEVNPDAVERCDELDTDEDCDGLSDDEQTNVDPNSLVPFYPDTDGDGFGDEDARLYACDRPDGYTPDDTDCDDTVRSTYPDAIEFCDGVDNNCDGQVDEDGALGAPGWYADADGDGHGNGATEVGACERPDGFVGTDGDCDDADASISPDASEVCDGLDNDCDGSTDDRSASDVSSWYADADGDGYGDTTTILLACEAPAGHVDVSGDCNDAAATAYPGAAEVCDGVDNSCDGVTDEDAAADASTWYRDADADGYGNPAASDTACSAPTGYVPDASDCDDRRDTTYPGATETCNDVDDDCDGVADEEEATDVRVWYYDADGDDYGNTALADVGCDAPSNYVAADGDCDDGASTTYPGADEYCDTADNDCDGTVDEDSAVDVSTWYRDTDGDRFGAPTAPDTACTAPSGYVADASDCDDTRSAVNPLATETCNLRDDDCDGTTDEDAASDAITWYRDADGDGYGTSGLSDVSCYATSGYVAASTDCDDGAASTYPGAPEYCDGLDDDCDGVADEDDAVDAATWYRDADADGYGSATVTDVACEAPTGWVADATDCDDGSASLDQDDADGDGWSTCEGDCNDADATLDPSDTDGDGMSTCEGDCDDTDASRTTCRDGQARKVDGTWIDVTYETCGVGLSCDASQAKAACTAIGKRVVSHASDGTSEVYSLGASNSCQWSISYYTVDSAMPSGACLVGISNLEWSSCCGTSLWHGNTRSFGSAGSIWGYVDSGNSGYVSSYSNSGGSFWGCNSESSGAGVASGCSSLYVACY